MTEVDLAPRPGHVVEIPAPGYRCNFCGAPATWDIPTRMGPWANACDECEPLYHTDPGATGVGVGQRLIVRQPDPTPGPGTVGAVLALKEYSRMRLEGAEAEEFGDGTGDPSERLLAIREEISRRDAAWREGR